MAIEVDLAQMHMLESKLRKLNIKGIPFAQIEAVNKAAFETQKGARREAGERMTLRNSWTTRSIQVDRATLRNPTASVGSTQQYMATQELGGTETSTGKHGVPIPTARASGEEEGAKPRKRAVKRRNSIGNIKLSRKARRGRMSRKQHLLVKVNVAVNSGERVIFHNFGGGKKRGIFRVKGGRRGVKRGWPKGARLEMLYDLSRRRVTTPPNPWLSTPSEQQTQKLPRYYVEALRKQLSRLR